MAGDIPTRPYKKYIIERLFNARYNDEIGEFVGDPVVMLSEVADEINVFNREYPHLPGLLSSRNPANFMKDIVRSASRNSAWPEVVLKAGYTGRQLVGGGRCFEFVPLPEGQTIAFAVEHYPLPSDATPRRLLQSASLPLASRRLGRRDEPWLMQVAVALNLVETHLSLYSNLPTVQQVDHLQMSVKLGASEIDGLYLAIYEAEDHTDEIIITVEAKGRNDDILLTQIIGQVKAIAAQPQVTQRFILPMAMKIVGESSIFVVEYDLVERDMVDELDVLTIASEAVYELRPHVPGIS